MSTLEAFKMQFRNRSGIHLNSAGQSPVSIRVSERVLETLNLQEREASRGDPELVRRLKEARERLAHFLGAEVDQLAYAPNVATALSQAALGFPLRRGDEVVVLDQEYSSNFFPWKVACERSGARLRVIPSGPEARVDEEKLLDALRPGVRILSVSWVQFQTGSLLDLKKLGTRCHEIGAYLIVDGIQALGQLPFSFRELPVDFIAGAAHKWMCSLLGQGFFAVKSGLMAELNPIAVGGGSFGAWGKTGDADARLLLSAARFEPGGLAFAPLFGLDAAVQLLEETGMAVVEGEITRLSLRLRSGIENLGIRLSTPKAQKGGITSFRLDSGHETRFFELCRQREVLVMKRGEFIRISPHAFVHDTEMDEVLQILKEVL